MPLQHGSSRAVVSQNISEMVHAGHPQNQAVAAAMRMAHRTARAYGGRAGFDMGGGTYTPPSPTFGQREAIRSEMNPAAGGVIASEIPGRTDKIPMSPAAGSYVIPADVVSGLGQGSTLAGARALDEMLHSGPYGTRLPTARARDTIPRPPAAPREGGTSRTTYTPAFASGGMTPRKPLKIAKTGDTPGGVPIIAAGGEYVVDSNIVKNHPMLGNGSMARGHGILDALVKHARAQHIKTLKSLPGPKK